jgi:hypothetical protein
MATDTMRSEAPTAQLPALVVNSPEAARLLAISERTLWGITSPRGGLACVRIGRAVKYRLEDLRAYLEGHRSNGVNVVDRQTAAKAAKATTDHTNGRGKQTGVTCIAEGWSTRPRPQ